MFGVNKPLRIPVISDKRLNELARRIRPIHNFGGLLGRRYVRPMKDELDYLRGVAYIWEPKPSLWPLFLGHLTELQEITTFHTWAYYGFFKPTIAEVLAQIPEDLVDQVVAFEILEMVDDNEALNDGYHVAITRLFGR